MDSAMDQVSVWMPLVINAVKALVVLIIGWFLAGFLAALAKKRIVSHPRIDDTIGGFASSIVRWLILLITVIAILQLFGIQATSLVAVLGAGTLAIGLALQGTLSDLAAGVMLIIFRPYKVGQFVDIGGTSGTVKDLNIFVTELVTPDNVQIIMPNGKAWGTVVTNFSAHSTRRLDLTFGIDYGDDIDKAVQIILDVANADARVHKDPEPWVRLTNLGDSSVDLGVRLWCDAGDYWELKFHMLKAVKEAFDAGGISIPYPHSVEIQKAG
ncbi:mechanosensitive ion channel family protein [Roseibium sp. Sym1]|uniref:mechanosensitive ion channel family protein n=1 Tax=Roseibium sp. Sym1 TaxID=3016006 RepID=UPI0022B41B08|nr:mechanosensitive ion channel domain-containing protein [Roseibium sp. Sym1]